MRYFIPIIFLLSGCVTTVPQLNNPTGYLKTAASYIDYDEYNDRRELKSFLGIDPARIEWCAAFVNSALHADNLPGSESVSDHPLTARSFLNYGKRADEPRVGDIVVLTRGTEGWQGHVGFFVGETKINGKTYYALLSGNNDDAVNIDWFDKRRVIGVRRVTSATLLELQEKSLLAKTLIDQQSSQLVQSDQ